MLRYDPDNLEEYDLAMQDKANRVYQSRLASNPDCRDPDHPGCQKCEEQEGD